MVLVLVNELATVFGTTNYSNPYGYRLHRRRRCFSEAILIIIGQMMEHHHREKMAKAGFPIKDDEDEDDYDDNE